MNMPFVSICIPSYNRPDTLLRLLKTIDSKSDDIQIVICEDMAPRRAEVRAVVEGFRSETRYEVKYIENSVNKGYDWNIRDFIIHADGEYIMYMGDDDGFIPGRLDDVLTFLRNNRQIGYMLRSSVRPSGEEMRYYSDTKFFDAGVEAYQELYRKSVFISGFTFKREWALNTMTDRFDGSLLYQLYILAEVCVNHPSAYLNIPFTQDYPDEKTFYFGSSEKEKGLYSPGKITVSSQMNFVSGFLKIAKYVDEKYRINSLVYIKKDISKYSYPILWWLMRVGRLIMLKGAFEMIRMGLGRTIYFYFYVFGLIFLGSSLCDRLIYFIKRKLGHTPQL